MVTFTLIHINLNIWCEIFITCMFSNTAVVKSHVKLYANNIRVWLIAHFHYNESGFLYYRTGVQSGGKLFSIQFGRVIGGKLHLPKIIFVIVFDF